MKTVTRIVYPGVTAASLRIRSPGGLGEHSRIRWGLFLLVACAGTSSAQLTDQTLAPNTAQAGIAKSLEDETGAGRGDPYTPDSSIFIINRDPFRSIRRGRQLFQRKFTREQGQGPNEGDCAGDIETNDAIGRCGKVFWPDAQFYWMLAQRIRDAGLRFKVNTVVNRLNLSENLGELMASLLPFRWKLLQVKEVIGQNDKTFAELAISVTEFADFVARNRVLVPPSVAVVPETADDMIASYAMIAPNGCFFDSSGGHYRYSRPILQAGIVEAFQEVAFDAEKFVKRGGSYE